MHFHIILKISFDWSIYYIFTILLDLGNILHEDLQIETFPMQKSENFRMLKSYTWTYLEKKNYKTQTKYITPLF